VTIYYLMERAYCDACRGTGYLPHPVYNPARKGERLANDDDCENCKGNGHTLEPVEFTHEILKEIL